MTYQTLYYKFARITPFIPYKSPKRRRLTDEETEADIMT